MSLDGRSQQSMADRAKVNKCCLEEGFLCQGLHLAVQADGQVLPGTGARSPGESAGLDPGCRAPT